MKFSSSSAAAVAVASLATVASAKTCKPKIDSDLIQADIKTEKYFSLLPTPRSLQ